MTQRIPLSLRLWILAFTLLLGGCGSGASGTCDSVSDCSGVEVCRDGQCVAVTTACDGPADCRDGSACIGGACRQPCVASSACADGLSCSPSGFCVQCTSDDECAADKYCGEGSCRPDVCVARSSSCESAASVKVCSDRGDAKITFACATDSSCVGAEGEKWCSGWVCKPGQSRCALDRNVAELCSPDGATLSEVACGDEAVCVEGACAPIVCAPGEKLCKDGSSHTCNGLGTGSKLDDFCGDGEYCNPDTGLCAFQLCEPNQLGCFDNQTGVCNDLGSAYEGLKACKSTEVCVGGACEPVICTPYANSCENGDVHLCNEAGTSTELYETCEAATQHCQQFSSYAFCSYDVCEGGAPVCNGNVLTTCMMDGSGYEPGGTPCGAGEACVDGECLATVCTSYSLFCENDDLRVCNSTGTGSELYRDCTSTQYCNAATNACSARICTPGATSCTGNVTRTCNAFGSGYVTGTDCASVPGTACDAGECRPVVCTPSAYSCDEQTLNRCNALGTGLASSFVCPTYQHCFADGGSAYCRYDVCTAGAAVCDGNTTSTCAADGSGPGAPGTDCSLAGEACAGGTCRPVVCTVGAMACHDGDFQYCIDNGTAFSLADDCSPSEYCNPVSGCLPQVCGPGVPMCSGEVATACAADGSGPAAGGTDCAASGQLCQDGACRPIICTGEWSCEGDELHHCQQRGTLDEVVDTCGAGEYCSAERQQCLHEICTPGETVCVDAFGFRTCNADGTGYDGLGTTCASGEVCEAGACGAPETVCSIATVGWGERETIRANQLIRFSLGVDEQDNLFVLGASSGANLVAQRYDASSGDWDEPVEIDLPGARTSDRVQLAVSGDGSAFAAYQTPAILRQQYLSHYDVVTKSWETAVAVGPPNMPLRISADAQGRFLRTTVDPTDGNLLGSVYVPGRGWGPTTRADTAAFVAGRSIIAYQPTLTPRGLAAIGWYQRGSGSQSAWWSRATLDILDWSAAERLSSAIDVVDRAPMLSYSSPDGSEAVLLYASTSGSTNSQVTFRRWSRAAGLSDRMNVGTFESYAVSRPFQLLQAPNGDTFFMTRYSVLRLPAGGSSWSTTTGPLGQVPNSLHEYIAFANGELLAVGEGAGDMLTAYRYSGGTWSATSVGIGIYDNVAGMLKLRGCRAAVFLNSLESGFSLRYIE